MSETIDVPLASVFHSSYPLDALLAVKYNVPFTFVKFSTLLLLMSFTSIGPGFITTIEPTESDSTVGELGAPKFSCAFTPSTNSSPASLTPLPFLSLKKLMVAMLGSAPLVVAWMVITLLTERPMALPVSFSVAVTKICPLPLKVGLTGVILMPVCVPEVVTTVATNWVESDFTV